MNRTRLLARWSAAAAAVTLIAGLAATPATARPDPGDPTSTQFSNYLNCPLKRIDNPIRPMRQPHRRRRPGTRLGARTLTHAYRKGWFR
jgi:hypothetical protein